MQIMKFPIVSMANKHLASLEIGNGSITNYRAEGLVCLANGLLAYAPENSLVHRAFYNEGGKEIFSESGTKAAWEFLLNPKATENLQAFFVPPLSVHLTKAGKLPAKYVFHAVYSVLDQRATTKEKRRDLGILIDNVLQAAESKQIKSLGFITLGTDLVNPTPGKSHFTEEDCAKTILQNIAKHCRAPRNVKSSLNRIGFITPDNRIYGVALDYAVIV